ncbi:MAG: hypothetical protein ACRDGD_03755, partial [Candidatus Limnocylindria bacterium]
LAIVEFGRQHLGQVATVREPVAQGGLGHGCGLLADGRQAQRASWLNQVETWFGILTRQAIRRGSFGSVKELIAMINRFTETWNAGTSPFIWVKTADEILAKAIRKRPATSEGRH